MRRAANAWLTTSLAICATAPAALSGQQDRDRPLRLDVRIMATFDSLRSNDTVERKFLGGNLRPRVAARISESLQNHLKVLFAQGAYNTITVRSSADTLSVPAADAHYDIACAVWIDGDLTLHVDIDVIGSGSQTARLEWRDIKVFQTGINYDSLPRWSSSDLRTEREIANLASKVVGQIGGDLYNALTQAAFRLRVRVTSTDVDSQSNSKKFRAFLVRAVEGELARSAAIFVLSGDAAGGRMRSEYDVEVSHEYIGGKVRIDIRCSKSGMSGRLLVSRYIIADTTDAEALSDSLADLAYGIRQTMEADFTKSSRSIAVVATTGAGGYRLRAPSTRDVAVAREVMRTMAQKIRILTQSRSQPLLQLQVLSDVPGSARYAMSWTPASQILADAESDYLLLLTYQNLGEKVRLTADLHSYDVDRVAAGTLIREQQVDLSQLEPVLNTVAVEVCHRFRAAQHSDTLPCSNDSTRNELKSIQLRTLERTRRFTFRFGSSVYRTSTSLFLERQGGTYGELSYAARPPFLRFGRGGGRYDGIIELTLGVEASSVAGSYLEFNGPAIAMALASFGVTVTPWAYSSTSFNVTVGGSLGLKGFRWNIREGQLDFNGTEPYRRSAFVPVWGAFAEADVPMSFAPSFGLTVMTRWFPTTRTVTEFKTLPLQRFADTGGPTGTLGGVYLAGGIAYRY